MNISLVRPGTDYFPTGTGSYQGVKNYEDGAGSGQGKVGNCLEAIVLLCTYYLNR